MSDSDWKPCSSYQFSYQTFWKRFWWAKITLSEFSASDDATCACCCLLVELWVDFRHFQGRPQCRQWKRFVQSLQQLDADAWVSLCRENLQSRKSANAFRLLVQRKHRSSIMDHNCRSLCLWLQSVWCVHRERHKWRQPCCESSSDIHSSQLHLWAWAFQRYRTSEAQEILGDT